MRTYTLNLVEYLNGKVEVEDDDIKGAKSYEYGDRRYNSFRDVLQNIYKELFEGIASGNGDKIKSYFTHRSDERKGNNGSTISMEIGGQSVDYLLPNGGTPALLQRLKNDVTKIAESDVPMKEILKKLEGKMIKFEFSERGENGSEKKEENMKIAETVEDAIKNNKQVIFTGAPGTGKTYSVRKYVEDNTGKDEKRSKFVQFHSSYDYTDFVEGLRPVPNGDKGNMFVRMDGTFKAFCREVVKANLKRLKFASIEDYFKAMTGNTDDEKQEIYKTLDQKPYYFIIDEINRADLSRVFGELMFGLEESYREVHNRFDTQYKNLTTYQMNDDGTASPIENDCFKNGFFVPYNLHIIGTMNDIDRSVESFDFALRRRFVWKDVKANDVMLETLKSMRGDSKNDTLTDDTLGDAVKRIQDMNEAISKDGTGLSEAYHIGPAYFKNLAKVSDDEVDKTLKSIFDERIEPILREYTRGRREKVTNDLIEDCKKALGIS